MPTIPALRRLKEKDHKLDASLGYTAGPYLKKQNKTKILLKTINHLV
jgi:hypothetical protein